MSLIDIFNPFSWVYYFFVVFTMLIDGVTIFLLTVKRNKDNETISRQNYDSDSFPAWNQMYPENIIEPQPETMTEKLSKVFSGHEMIICILILNLLILFYEFVLNSYTFAIFIASITAFLYFTKCASFDVFFGLWRNAIDGAINFIRAKMYEIILGNSK